jgi:hypothetical protein
MASSSPCFADVARASVRAMMKKSDPSAAALAASSFATISSLGITALVRPPPKRLGHAWSSRTQPLEPPAISARTVRCTFRMDPPPVRNRATGVWVVGREEGRAGTREVQARKRSPVQLDDGHYTAGLYMHAWVQFCMACLAHEFIPASASAMRGSVGTACEICPVTLAISCPVNKPRSGSPSIVADTCTTHTDTEFGVREVSCCR